MTEHAPYRMWHPAGHYTQPAGHWRITQRVDSPPRSAEGKAFLYVVQFKDIAKVGVTTDVAGRIATHERARRCAMECAYLILLDRAEAFQREGVIKDLFAAGTTPKGRSGEWFARTDLPQAVLVMRHPFAAQWIRVQQTIDADWARDGHDPRFELKSSDPRALWREEDAA